MVGAAQPARVDGVQRREPTRGERGLADALAAELSGVDPARPCCRVAERAGLADASPRRRRHPWFARVAVRLGRTMPGETAFDWDTAADHCRIAFLRGRFLAGGSLSLAGGRTHLEFLVPAVDADEFAERLTRIGLPASARTRRGTGVVTWKNAETVLRFLRLAGASASVLELEARLVGRSLGAELNRLINAETANLHRSVAAAARQLDAISLLDAAGDLARLPETDRLVAAARRDAPEATLTELAARTALPRATVQRSLARLEWLALQSGERAARG
jgi:DNA-binding transcriptional regulator WhiA